MRPLDFKMSFARKRNDHLLCRMEVYSTCTTVFENFNNLDGGEKFMADRWYHVAVSMGAVVDGKKSVFLMSGSQPGTVLNLR